MQFEVGDYRVSINITEPGVYILGEAGGTGKSFLYKLSKIAGEIGVASILSITYDSSKSTKDYIYTLAQAPQVIVIDRYDLFATREITDTLIELGSSKIVLVDVKRTLSLKANRFLKSAELKLERSEVIVNENTFDF